MVTLWIDREERSSYFLHVNSSPSEPTSAHHHLSSQNWWTEVKSPMYNENAYLIMLNNASKSTCCRHKLKIKQLRTVIYIVLYRSSNSVWKLNQTCVETVRQFVYWKAFAILGLQRGWNEAYYFNITGIQDEKMRDQGLRIDRRRSARF